MAKDKVAETEMVPTLSISIGATRDNPEAGFVVEIETPFLEGHTLNAGEAAALSALFVENVRNNNRKKATAALEAGTDEAAETFLAEFTAYIGEYELNGISVKKSAMTPVEKEALSIAREWLRGKLAESGKKVKDYKESVGEDGYNAKLAEIAANPVIIKTAEKNVEAAKKITEEAVEVAL